MRKKQLMNLFEEKSERVLVLETRLETLQQQLDAYREREHTIVASLSSAQTAAAQQIQEAEEKGNALLEEAGRNARQTVDDARREADAALQSARQQAADILSDAARRKAELLDQAERDLAAYRAQIERLNALLNRCATDARGAAEQFAAFCATTNLDPAPTAEPADVVDPASLPDPEDDPAQLMKNIYKLQNRDVCVPEQPLPAQDIPEAEPVAAIPAQDIPGEEERPMPDFAPSPQDAYSDEPESFDEPYAPEPDWQPDEEDATAPRVSELMPDDEQVEMSLDALLDEIIRSGE